MSVCLISLPSPFLIDDKVFPNLGILYVASALQLQGKDVYVHDGAIEDIPPDFSHYCISATTPQFPVAQKALSHLKNSSVFRKPRRIIIGGPHATVDPDSCLKAGFDGVVIGDGEIGCRIAIEHKTKRVEADVAIFGFPARDLIDIKSYKYFIDGRPATSVMTSRGCPYACGFCCKSTGKVRLAPAMNVIGELQELKDKYGFTAFMFFDDIFIMAGERFNAITDWLRCNDIKWRGFARADLLVKGGRGLALRMKESGCVEVGIGIESGSPKILQTINKGEDIDTIKKAIWMLQEQDIRVKGFFIVGLPGEDWLTVDETALFLKEMKLSDADFSIFTPFRGSRIYENKHEYDIYWGKLELEKLWYKGIPGEYESLVRTSELSEEDIVTARNELERKFKKWNTRKSM